MSSTSTHKDQRDVPHKCSTSLLEYKTNYKKRGWAIIFNQEESDEGSTKDEENLTERFKELGFEVSAYDNLTKDEMMAKINEAAKHDHTDSDCFICVFLNHGKEDYIRADDDEVEIQEITNLFKGNKCKSLVGKPKIFFFQASKIEMPFVTPMTADSEDVIYTLPTGADFLMCYSVAEDNSSFYIENLCEMLKEAGSSLEFTELLTLVNLKVATRGETKQMPYFTSMLTKKLYFRPKKE